MTDERPDFEGDPSFIGTPPLAGHEAPEPPAPLQAPETPPEAAQPVQDVFPPQVNEDVTGLMHAGHLTHSFQLLGHNFVIRTLKAAEELAVTGVVKQYEGTLGEGKAYAMGMVSAAIVTVDGQPLTRPLGPSDASITTAISQNFHYVGTNWVWPIIEAIYAHYSDLILRQAEAFRQFEGKSEASRPTS